MSSIIYKRKDKSIAIEKSTWFLCRFLCHTVNEDNFEKVREYVSSFKGVKTRLRLSETGAEIGFKPSHVRHFHHKIKYEVIPLAALESVIQDVMYVNVLLCICHVSSPAGLDYEIIAFKFKDFNVVKRFQDISNILLGGVQTVQSYNAPGRSGNITLMPSKSYHLGTLAPERWASSDRLNSGGSVLDDESEISYTRSARGAQGYGTIIPATDVQRQGLTNQQRMLDVDDASSLTSGLGQTLREVAVSANLESSPSNARLVLNSQSGKPYVQDTSMVRDTGCQAATSLNGYPNHLRAESGSIVSAQSSGVFDEDTGHVLHGNGVSLAYSGNRSRHNNIALTSMDVIDNRDHDGDRGLTSSIRRVFEKTSRKGHEENGVRDRYPSNNDFNRLKVRSQSVDQFNTGRMMSSSSRSDIRGPTAADAMSIRSQASYYLVPNFKKVYAPRSGRAMSSSGYAPEGSVYRDNSSRLYAGSEIRRNGRY